MAAQIESPTPTNPSARSAPQQRSGDGRRQRPTRGQPAGSPYARQRITKAPNWGVLTALDILLNNLSAGLFLVAAIGSLFAPAHFGPLTPLAYPLALALLVADLLLLVSDLGDPLRFHHMLRVFKLSSPMSFGTWALTTYGILLGIAAVVAVLHWPLFAGLQTIGWLWTLLGWIGFAAALLAIPPAGGALLYKGVLFSVSAQPGWQAARWFGAYICNSAILMGSSLLLLLAAIAGQAAAAASLRLVLLALLLVDVVLLYLVYRSIAPVFQQRYGPNQKLFFWLILIAAAWVLPFFLLLPGAMLELIPPLLILLAAVVVRLALVMLPQGPQPDPGSMQAKDVRV